MHLKPTIICSVSITPVLWAMLNRNVSSKLQLSKKTKNKKKKRPFPKEQPSLEGSIFNSVTYTQ